MKSHRRAAIATAIVALGATAAPASAQTKLTSYPSPYDTSRAGSPLPSTAMTGPLAFDDEFKTLSVCADNVPGCKWYAPIVPKLGTGQLALASNRAAISLATHCLTLQTINPSSSGVGGTDVNLQTMDAHGHGFSITNGYVEAGISLPTAHGSHAGFWFNNIQGPQGHGEADFPETYGAADRVFTSAVHWWPTAASRFAYQVTVHAYWVPSPSAYGVWHTYGALFTPTQICTYMDRKQIGCTARLPEMSKPWFPQFSVLTDANRKDGYQPAMMRVAYVRAWGK